MKIERRNHWTLATLCLFGSVVLAAEVPQQETRGTQDMKSVWVEKHLPNAKSALPFSFTYDGQPSAKLLVERPAKVENQRLDEHRTRQCCATPAAPESRADQGRDRQRQALDRYNKDKGTITLLRGLTGTMTVTAQY